MELNGQTDEASQQILGQNVSSSSSTTSSSTPTSPPNFSLLFSQLRREQNANRIISCTTDARYAGRRKKQKTMHSPIDHHHPTKEQKRNDAFAMSPAATHYWSKSSNSTQLSTASKADKEFDEYLQEVLHPTIWKHTRCPYPDFTKGKFWHINLHRGVLEWWRPNRNNDHGKKYPRLSQLARKYLAFIPSASMSEKVWSKTGSVWTNERDNLECEYVRAISSLSMTWKQIRKHPEHTLLAMLRIFFLEGVQERVTQWKSGVPTTTITTSQTKSNKPWWITPQTTAPLNSTPKRKRTPTTTTSK